MGYARYPLSFKLKIVTEVILNEEKKGIQSKVATKYGISNFSVSNWVKKYRNQVELRSGDKENTNSKSVERTPNIVEQENELLKSILIQKEFEIKLLKNQFDLKEMNAN